MKKLSKEEIQNINSVINNICSILGVFETELNRNDSDLIDTQYIQEYGDLLRNIEKMLMDFHLNKKD